MNTTSDSPTRTTALLHSVAHRRAAFVGLVTASLLFTSSAASSAQNRWDTRGPVWTTWWRSEREAILEAHPRSRYARAIDAPARERLQSVLESLPASREEPELVARTLVARARAVEYEGSEAGVRVCAAARERLESGSPIVGAAARIALGLAGGPVEAELLSTHAMGTRALMSSSRSPETEDLYRAHATFALGVHGARTDIPSRAAYVVSALKSVLHAEGSSALARRAAILGLGMTPARELATEPVHGQALAVLLQIAEDTGRPADDRALAVGAAARHAAVLESSLRKTAIERVLALLEEKNGAPVSIQAGVATALGAMVHLGDDAHDVSARQILWRFVANSAPEVRVPAILALGQIASGDGADDGERGDKRTIRERLRSGLEAGRAEFRPWFGLALARLECELASRESGVEKQRHASRILLEAQLAEAELPEHVGAWSIAVGVLGSMDSAPKVRQLFTTTTDVDARGYTAVALGLVGQPTDFGALIAQLTTNRTPLDGGTSFAIALGALGTGDLLPQLVKVRDQELMPWAIDTTMEAVARIGGAKAIEALAIWASDKAAPTARRAAAVRALGWIADEHRDRWQAAAGTCVTLLRSVDFGGPAVGLLDHE